MKRRTRIGLVVGLAVAVLAGATAVTVGAHGGRPALMKRMVTAVIDDALDEARVTPGQRASIYAARDRVLETFEQRRSTRTARIEELLRLFEADQLDAARTDALRAQAEAAHQALVQAIEQAIVEVHAVLDPAQRKALADYVRSHRRFRS
ncbi:MAG: periplasmic heavy metal sensor [Candidatus Rokubacteria bacterium]|nr:periplasmic heavy metal sensor [Candidatus Rokubacteria bacterium]